MSARDEILGRVRAALATAQPPSAVSRDYVRPFTGDVLALFVERVQDYRAVVHRCPRAEVEDRIASVLDGARAVVPPDLPWLVPGSIVDAGLSAQDLDDIEAVVTAASVAIALTGTVVLDHGPGQGRRALSLLPDLHVCVVRADQVVHGVPDAVARLNPARPQTWISGPSATSDIELERVEGVHGPRHLQVLLTEW